MSVPSANTRRNPRSRSLALVFIVAVFAVVAAGLFWRTKARSERLPPRIVTRNPSGQALHAVSPDAERAGRIRQLAAYWNEHKARLRQLLTVDHAAALARRNEKFPDVAAVVKFGEEYAHNFERQNYEVFVRAEEQDKKYRARREEIEAQGRGGLGGDLLLAERWLANAEPVSGGINVGDLARQFWTDDPNGLIILRRLAANAERRISKDEAAAQRVEALQTPQEMADYVRAARLRWEAEQTQVNMEAGYDAQVSEYLLGSQCAEMLSTLTKNYEKRSHAGLDAIGKESDQILQAMDEPFLAATSRDDEESRRLLTELKEYLLMRRQEMAADWPRRVRLNPGVCLSCKVNFASREDL